MEIPDAICPSIVKALELLIVHLKSAVESSLGPHGEVDPVDAQNVREDRREIRRARLLITTLKAAARGTARPVKLRQGQARLK